MYITELEIDNFKSFVKKTKIPFFDGFTVISGPNGSGKSNIVDAVLFVLALSGSRGLRAEKLTDLINLNSGKNSAEVSLCFSDGTRIRRRIKKTGSGYYSYNYLNDRLCKQTDVVDLLARHGVKPHGYNVVMQGDITRIIEMSDGDRRKIIDEIAGVAEFDAKKEQALAELEVVRERIEREELLLRELSTRLEELSRERENAIAYVAWQEKLEVFQKARAAAELREREKELLSLTRLVSDQQLELDRIASDRGLEENELAYLREDQKEVAEEINKKSGAEYLKLIADLEEAKGSIRFAEQTVERLKREKESNLEAMNRNYIDGKRVETRVTESTDAIRNLSIDRTNLAMEAAGARARYEQLGIEINRHSRDTEDARETLFSLLEALERAKEARSSVLHEQDMLLERSRMRTTEKERLEEQIASADREIEGKTQELEKIAAQVKPTSDRIAAIDRTLSAGERSLLDARSKLESVRGEMRQLEAEAVRLEAQAQARGDAGGKALEAVSGMDGVHGTIASLGKVPPEYATALNVAAGSKLHYVVVGDDSVAAGAIRYLKEENLGRITFLPLNKLKPAPRPPVTGPGIVGYAADLLEFDNKYRDAFGVVFGSTLVVDTLDRARKMIGTHRMVTLGGELVERSGAMTGGSFRKPVKGFGAAINEDLARIRADLAGLAADAADLESSVKRGTEEVDAGRAERAGLLSETDHSRMVAGELNRQVESLRSTRDSIAASLSTLDAEVREGSASLAGLEKRFEEANAAHGKAAAEIDALKKKLEDTSLPALTEQLEKTRKEAEDLERRLANKDADINDLQRERQHFAKRIEEIGEEKERLSATNRQIDTEVGFANASAEAARELIRQIEERQKLFSSELTELRTKHVQVSESIAASEKRLLEFEASAERMRIQLSALSEKEAAMSAEISGMRERVGDGTTDLPLEEIDAGIAEAGHEMRRLGAVNMLAIEEYDRVAARVNERTARKETLSRERTTILERIEHFGKMKFEAFSEAFRGIDANFREVFARLTGGSGHLILENEEDPFAGGLSFAVQPKDRPVHLLSALSGGEKSLTTLAFIFSIQKYLPAPFYAFDEVDMSLDGSNVERIAGMLRELAAQSQFVIVSLRKPMIDGADRIVGVTLREDKSTLVTGVKINE